MADNVYRFYMTTRPGIPDYVNKTMYDEVSYENVRASIYTKERIQRGDLLVFSSYENMFQILPENNDGRKPIGKVIAWNDNFTVDVEFNDDFELLEYMKSHNDSFTIGMCTTANIGEQKDDILLYTINDVDFFVLLLKDSRRPDDMLVTIASNQENVNRVFGFIHPEVDQSTIPLEFDESEVLDQ